MICENCGGDFADWAEKCPYCGAIHYPGAEKAYMERLEGIRKDMETLPGQSEEHYHKGIQSMFRRVGLLLAALACGAAVLAGLLFVWGRYQERKMEEWTIRRQAWEAETFPKLDAWYAEGDYDSILALDAQLLQDNHEFGLYGWEHYMFINQYYLSYQDCLYLSDVLEEGKTPTEMDLAMGLRGGLFLWYHTTEESLARSVSEWEQWGYGLTEEEAGLVKDYQKQAQQTLFQDLKLPREEAEQLYQQCLNQDGYMISGPCYDYAESMRKRMGWEE